MIYALLHREVIAHRGRADTTAPVTALYTSSRVATGWAQPALLPFSGTHQDYEAAFSSDGNFIVFNSKRPYPDGRVPDRNDLYIAERSSGTWSTPRPLGVNTFDLEESYPTLDRSSRMVFVRGPTREGTDDFDVYETRLLGDGSVAPPQRLPFSGDAFGEGDPQLAHDGSFLIFTRWDHRIGWQQTCDLFIAFRHGDGWTAPVPLPEVNTAAPDYAPALSSDGAWLYYRAGPQYLRRPIAPLLEAARAQTR
jgi:hypothetical protein